MKGKSKHVIEYTCNLCAKTFSTKKPLHCKKCAKYLLHAVLFLFLKFKEFFFKGRGLGTIRNTIYFKSKAFDR